MSEQPLGKRPKNCFAVPNSPNWQFDFVIAGERDRGTTGTRSSREAEVFVAERKALMRRKQAARCDGTGKRTRERISVVAACDLYEAKVAKTGRDGQRAADITTAYQLANLVALICGDNEERLVSDVETGDFERYRMSRPSLVTANSTKRGPLKGSTINREIELARRVWRYAARLGYDVGIGVNWAEVIDKTAEVRRIRELTIAEEKRLMPALAAINPDLHSMVEFALLSGQRKAALVGLRWSDIDWDNRNATILLKSRGERKREHTIPLTTRMVEIIKSRPRVGPMVFTYECRRNAPRRVDRVGRIKGDRYPFSKYGWTRQWHQALANAEIDNFRWHDLRHTAATRLLRRVNNLKAAQKLLGHSSIDQTARYAHVFNDDLRTMMEDAETFHAGRLNAPASAPAVANAA